MNARSGRYIVTDHEGSVIARSSSLSGASSIAGTDFFVIDASTPMMFVYRSHGERGRFIGEVDGPWGIPALLSRRCEWCAFPARTGYLSERDQMTPRCEHAK
jgi:hypothetical protein